MQKQIDRLKEWALGCNLWVSLFSWIHVLLEYRKVYEVGSVGLMEIARSIEDPKPHKGFLQAKISLDSY